MATVFDHIPLSLVEDKTAQFEIASQAIDVAAAGPVSVSEEHVVRRLLNGSNEVFGISEAVNKHLQSHLLPSVPAHLLPYDMVTPAATKAAQARSAPATRDIAFLFVGSYTEPNFASLRWLCAELVPLLDEKRPLHVVG